MSYTKDEFVDELRALCRGSKILNEVAWSMVTSHDCESFAELHGALGDNEQLEMIVGLNDLRLSLEPASMQRRLR